MRSAGQVAVLGGGASDSAGAAVRRCMESPVMDPEMPEDRR
jgi:hypothetical protein